MTSNERAVLNYFSQRTTVDPSLIDHTLSLIKTGLLDSLQLIELIIWLEKETDAPVETEELLNENDINIQSVIRYLNNHIA